MLLFLFCSCSYVPKEYKYVRQHKDVVLSASIGGVVAQITIYADKNRFNPINDGKVFKGYSQLKYLGFRNYQLNFWLENARPSFVSRDYEPSPMMASLNTFVYSHPTSNHQIKHFVGYSGTAISIPYKQRFLEVDGSKIEIVRFTSFRLFYRILR